MLKLLIYLFIFSFLSFLTNTPFAFAGQNCKKSYDGSIICRQTAGPFGLETGDGTRCKKMYDGSVTCRETRGPLNTETTRGTNCKKNLNGSVTCRNFNNPFD
jgi:hypothetical protein